MTYENMTTSVNQIKTIEEKLRIYNQPFIDSLLLQKILDKFAPKYQIKALSSRGLIAPIRRDEIYLNLMYHKKETLVGTTILAQYGI